MLDISDDAGLRVITLARPPVNALNGDLARKLVAAVEGASESRRGRDCRSARFVFGRARRAGLLALDREGLTALFVDLWRAQRAIATSPVPIVFAITGHCPAGGTVLAINGDYRVMAAGRIPARAQRSAGGTVSRGPIHGAFKRLVGGHAAQLLTRGALIDPATALRIGLVDELCEPDEGDGARGRSGARVLRIAARTDAAYARDGAPRPHRSVRHCG